MGCGVKQQAAVQPDQRIPKCPCSDPCAGPRLGEPATAHGDG